MNILTPLWNELAHIPKTQKQLRSFGVLFGIIFTGLFVFFYYWSMSQHDALLFIGITALILGVLSPKRLYYPYMIWMGFGIIMGILVNKVVLTLIFYILISPSAFIYRLFKQKPHNETTFWIKRSEGADDASINQQF